MSNNKIKDLCMAGVNWEINENPTPTKLNTKPETPETNNIVPPIEPAVKKDLNDVQTLDELSAAISEYNHPLKQFAKNTVLPDFGDNSSGLLIITDMPSDVDENNKKILTNGAGELLNKMLSAIEIDRTTTSIIPILAWRTPGGRTPEQSEIDSGMDFVKKAIDIINPRVILTLGAITATAVANAKIPKDMGGTLKSFDNIDTISIYHPSFLILKPDAKRDVWNALQNLQKLLKNGTNNI